MTLRDTMLRTIAKIVDPSMSAVLTCPFGRIIPSGKMMITVKKMKRDVRIPLKAEDQKVLSSY